MDFEERLIGTTDAAAMLGIKTATLYAYVSRGLLSSHRKTGDRGSWFDPVEIDRLARSGRSTASRHLSDVQFRSSITLIENGRCWLRGRELVELARSAHFEGVAELLWAVDETTEHDPASPVGEPWAADRAGVDVARAVWAAVGAPLDPLDRIRLAVPALGALDPFRADLDRRAVALVGRRVLATLCEAQIETGTQSPDATPGGPSIAGRLWQVVSSEGSPGPALGVPVVDLALALLADHEIAASTSAVRIAASFRADPYACIAAGLGTLSGALHGGASREVRRLLDDACQRGVAAALGERLAQGQLIPGLGQRLYPDGDPRAQPLLAAAQAIAPDSPVIAVASEIAEVVEQRGWPRPNVDFGLGVAERALALVPGTGELIFTIGRMAGWLAHAMEEYEHRTDLRLRSAYVGRRPEPTR